jgi:hypothetical protein
MVRESLEEWRRRAGLVAAADDGTEEYKISRFDSAVCGHFAPGPGVQQQALGHLHALGKWV